MKTIQAQELKNRMDQENAPKLLDVREDYEREEFHIGGLHIPLGDLPMKVSELDMDTDEEVVVYCRSGKRSAMAQMVLQEYGFVSVYNLEGGMNAWMEIPQ